MYIENPDAFKSWLTSILEPLCDADPAALAKYVYALVKKDKPLEELRDGMVDQLDVFLQHETKPFVEMLFKSLETLEYLVEAKKLPSPPPQPAEVDNEVDPEPVQQNSAEVGDPQENKHQVTEPSTNGVPEEPLNNHEGRNAYPPSPPAAAPPKRVVVRARPPQEQTLVKVLPLNELLDEPVEPTRRRDRRDGPRDIDRRRRRSRDWGRPRPPRRPHRELEHDRARRSRSPRYRNRSPSLDRPHSRSRSRSPVPLREHERDRLRVPRELERDRMSRDRDHRDRLSRDRERNRSRDRSRERSRDRSMSPHAEPHVKRRCRDFDEKGYCMRGDLCQWDHGADPVVLEDTALTRLIPQPSIPEYNPLTPDIWCGGPGFPPYPHPMPPHPPRELIPIPRMRHEGPPMPGHPMMPMMPRHPPPPRKHFDYNRLGMGPQRPPLPQHAANCSLEVKKVPRGLNDITHLNNHFSKFGKIVNIQVCYEGDPEGALITFSSPTEANVAHKSTEAVLNNRFIKVFWHNPENKQENTAPGAQQNKPVNNGQPPNPHMSHNKVLINRDNMRATADNKQQQIDKDKQAKEELTKSQPPAEPKKEITAAPKPLDKTKQVMEMHKRAQALLETQLQQQVLLIQRLESGNVQGPRKAALMEAINSAQEGIEKLRKELVQYNKTIRTMQEESVSRLARLNLQAKRPKTREEWQKELLDAELDMFTKQQEGQDVTEIAKRIADLRRQMTSIFPAHPVAPRRPHPRTRFNTATRFTRGAAAAKTFASNSIDHRPKALLISGFEPDELQALVAHFSQFGEVTGKEVNLAVPELVLQYKARSQAEQALLRGKNYNDRTLSITWVTNNKPIGVCPGAAAHSGDNGENVQQSETPSEVSAGASEETLLRFDEDDEEETEDRSWRR